MLIKDDYTLAKKINNKHEKGFIIGQIYITDCPEEDEDELTLWTSHHLYNPKDESYGTINNFIVNIEDRAYIDYGGTVEELLENESLKWFASERELNEHLDELNNNEVGIAPLYTLPFVVSTLNSWLEGDELYEYYEAEFGCERKDIVNKYGFVYENNEDKTLECICGDDIVSVNLDLSKIFKMIIDAESKSKEDRIRCINKIFEYCD